MQDGTKWLETSFLSLFPPLNGRYKRPRWRFMLLPAALLQLIPNKGLKRNFRQVGQSKETEKGGSVSCNRSLMVVVVSRRNSTAIVDVV